MTDKIEFNVTSRRAEIKKNDTVVASIEIADDAVVTISGESHTITNKKKSEEGTEKVSQKQYLTEDI